MDNHNVTVCLDQGTFIELLCLDAFIIVEIKYILTWVLANLYVLLEVKNEMNRVLGHVCAHAG